MEPLDGPLAFGKFPSLDGDGDAGSTKKSYSGDSFGKMIYSEQGAAVASSLVGRVSKSTQPKMGWLEIIGNFFKYLFKSDAEKEKIKNLDICYAEIEQQKKSTQPSKSTTISRLEKEAITLKSIGEKHLNKKELKEKIRKLNEAIKFK